MYILIDNEKYDVTGIIKSNFSVTVEPKMKILFILVSRGINYTMGWFDDGDYRLYGGKMKNYLYARGRFATDLRIG